MSSSPDPKTPREPPTTKPLQEEQKAPIESKEQVEEGEQQQRQEEEEEEEEDGEGEEEGECGFCLFMKGGGCKDTFTAWEDCIKDAEEKGLDIVEKCFDATSKLRQCMQAHADYYEPILRAEKVAEEEAVKELEKEREREREREREKELGASVSP